MFMRASNDVATNSPGCSSEKTFRIVIETLGYSLREMIEIRWNTPEWMASGIAPSIGQPVTWSGSLLDQGIGIRESLARNPHLNLTTDENAIQQAILPGVRRRLQRGKEAKE